MSPGDISWWRAILSDAKSKRAALTSLVVTKAKNCPCRRHRRRQRIRGEMPIPPWHRAWPIEVRDDAARLSADQSWIKLSLWCFTELVFNYVWDRYWSLRGLSCESLPCHESTPGCLSRFFSRATHHRLLCVLPRYIYQCHRPTRLFISLATVDLLRSISPTNLPKLAGFDHSLFCKIV